jgi:hypothetical protein
LVGVAAVAVAATTPTAMITAARRVRRGFNRTARTSTL